MLAISRKRKNVRFDFCHSLVSPLGRKSTTHKFSWTVADRWSLFKRVNEADLLEPSELLYFCAYWLAASRKDHFWFNSFALLSRRKPYSNELVSSRRKLQVKLLQTCVGWHGTRKYMQVAENALWKHSLSPVWLKWTHHTNKMVKTADIPCISLTNRL